MRAYSAVQGSVPSSSPLRYHLGSGRVRSVFLPVRAPACVMSGTRVRDIRDAEGWVSVGVGKGTRPAGIWGVAEREIRDASPPRSRPLAEPSSGHTPHEYCIFNIPSDRRRRFVFITYSVAHARSLAVDFSRPRGSAFNLELSP